MSVVIASGVTNTHLPRLGWRAITGTITASSAASGFGAALAATPQTYSAWRPTALPATWAIDAGSAQAVDYCGIGAHEIGSNGGTVFVEYLVGSTWTLAATVTPTDDTALLFLFPEVTAQEWRVRITGGTPARVGNIRFGKVTTLPRQSTFAPALPITEAEQFTYNVNVSATGEWLGRSVVAAGLEFSFQVEHVSETFAAGEWALFRKHCNEGSATFYVAPKPAAYPKEVAYAWPSDTVRANRAFPKKEISRTIELQCNGYKRP
jgi:hypothetical protein